MSLRTHSPSDTVSFHIAPFPFPEVRGIQDAAGATGISVFWDANAQGDRICCKTDALLFALPDSSALLAEKIISRKMYSVDMFFKQ